MISKLRIIIADDERPSRAFLAALLASFDFVILVGEAETGREAVELIEREKPDLALLDLQMPEIDGFGVVRLLRKNRMPLVAFVTAYDEYAVRAFEVNAVDYLLKPVDRARLGDTLQRAQERLEQADIREQQISHFQKVATDYEAGRRQPYLERIPVRQRHRIVILPVSQITCVVADGEILHIGSGSGESYIITYRLKDLEARLDPSCFLRLARGTLANVDFISHVTPMPGGTYIVTLTNRQELSVSRLQARRLRDQLLRI
jgi:two-component system LytT family response regulator